MDVADAAASSKGTLREQLLAQVVDLVNDAKLDAKEEKHVKLAQVLEIAMHRDTSLLPEVVPMIADFQVR